MLFFAMASGRSLRRATTDEVLRAFERQLAENPNQMWQVYGLRRSPTTRDVYRLNARQLTGRGLRGWWHFDHGAEYLGPGDGIVCSDPLIVQGGLDLLATFGIDTPHKLGLLGAVRAIKEHLARRGMEVTPLKVGGTVLAFRSEQEG